MLFNRMRPSQSKESFWLIAYGGDSLDNTVTLGRDYHNNGVSYAAQLKRPVSMPAHLLLMTEA